MEYDLTINLKIVYFIVILSLILEKTWFLYKVRDQLEDLSQISLVKRQINVTEIY